jgi:hypothetical protein
MLTPIMEPKALRPRSNPLSRSGDPKSWVVSRIAFSDLPNVEMTALIVPESKD